MKAILINRVSDAHQTEGYSLDEQEYQGKKYASCKKIKISKIFTFQETASKYTQRKRFDEIISYIANETAKKESCITVIAEKRDRLYRNHANKLQLQLFLEQGKIEIHLYKERKILTKDSPPEEFLVDDVMTSVNQYQARNTGREAKKGMLSKARSGWYPHKAPFGYTNYYPEQRDDKNRRRGQIKPLPFAEILIPRMFGLRLKGHSLRSIHETVIREGLVPANLVTRFHASRVEYILKHSFYMGEYEWGGERCIGKHRPLVTKKDWQSVQETFRSKVVPIYTQKKRRGVFSGFLKCACGCQVTYDPKDKPSGIHYDYYRCANGRKAHPNLRYVTEENIFNQFAPAVESISISEQLADEIAEALNKVEKKAQAAHQRNIDDLKARLKEMENAEDGIYDDLKKGVLDENGYKRQLKRVRDERQNLSDVLGEAQQEVTGAVLVTARKILELAKKARELYLQRSAKERRDFLNKILSNPVLDGVSVRYELKKP
jgi:DNA invertase Pin-like site-specific DNA recombinase